MNKKGIYTIAMALCYCAAAPLSGCGKGKAGPPNDASPGGTVVAQGQFTGLNTKTVTGVVSIHRLSDFGNYVVRLEGISAPNEAGLEVIAGTTTETVLRSFLRSSQGTQNYNTTASGTPTWVSVTVHSTQTGYDYGKATLDAVPVPRYGSAISFEYSTSSLILLTSLISQAPFSKTR